MAKINPICFLLVFAFGTFFSCTKDDEPLASVVGIVNLVDDSGFNLINRSGVTVTSLNNGVSTSTNDRGKYVMSLKIGTTYEFQLTKEGYGSVFLANCDFLPGPKSNLMREVTLYQVPLHTLVSSEFKYENYKIIFKGTASSSKPFNSVFYINDSVDVSDTHYDYMVQRYGTNGNSFEHILMIQNTAYKSGTTVYGVLYFNNSFELPAYDNYTKARYYTSSKKVSEVLSIILP